MVTEDLIKLCSTTALIKLGDYMYKELDRRCKKFEIEIKDENSLKKLVEAENKRNREFYNDLSS